MWERGIVECCVSSSDHAASFFTPDDGLLGEGGWLKVVKLADYAAKRPAQPTALREALFPHAEAL